LTNFNPVKNLVKCPNLIYVKLQKLAVAQMKRFSIL